MQKSQSILSVCFQAPLAIALLLFEEPIEMGVRRAKESYMKILVSIDHSTASSEVIDAIEQALWPLNSHFEIVHVLGSLEGLGTPSSISTPEWHNSLTAAQGQMKKSATNLLQDFVESSN